MESLRLILNNRLKEGKSIAVYAIGYYISCGGRLGFDIKVPIFKFIEESETNIKVLIEYLGSMMWINVKPKHAIYGCCHSGKIAPNDEGKLIRLKLEALKQ